MTDISATSLAKEKMQLLKEIQERNAELQELRNDPEQDIKELKQQWTDLIIETQRLKLDYDRLVHELEEAKDVLINVHYGNTWRYKLAKWLIK